VNVHFVNSIDEALAIALPQDAAEARHDAEEREHVLQNVG